jgi:hypothetical protein
MPGEEISMRMRFVFGDARWLRHKAPAAAQKARKKVFL